MKSKTTAVILEYCGGSHTDALYEALRSANPDTPIHVLDNASPRNRSRYVTTRNRSNSHIGGGLIDCIRLAERERAEFLFFIVNDIDMIRVPSIAHFEALATQDNSVVLVGASITQETGQAVPYPWMVNQGRNEDRVVPHCDALCCLFRLDFIRGFGGFPPSKSGWGYDLQFACFARFRDKKIIVSDTGMIHHAGDPKGTFLTRRKQGRKLAEMKKVYDALLGDHRLLDAWRTNEVIPELLMQFGPERSTESGPKLDDMQRQRAVEHLLQQIPST
jgi:hypothetical protein